MTEQAGPSVILVDATTYRRARNRFDFDGPHEIQVKGKGSLTVYRLLGQRAAAATPAASATG